MMGKVSGTWKKTRGCLCAVGVFSMLLFPVLTAQAEERNYDVIFRAGSHGTVGNATSVTQSFPYGTAISVGDCDNMVQQESGYFFTGWNPQIEATVTGKEVYVAQYRRLIHGVDCRISYVDGNGAALSTQLVKTVEKGEQVTFHPINIEGYTANENEKTVAIEQAGTEIIFVYTRVGEAAAGQTTNEPEGMTAANDAGAVGNRSGIQGTENRGEADRQLTDVPDHQVPLDGREKEKSIQTIADEAVPQALKLLQSKWGWVPVVVGIISLLALAAVIVLLIKRKKSATRID